MQHREPSLRGYGAGEDGRHLAHVAEVILCEVFCMAQLSHSLLLARFDYGKTDVSNARLAQEVCLDLQVEPAWEAMM